MGENIDPFTHALKRPDSTLGSVLTEEKKIWVSTDRDSIAKKKIMYNHGLVHIVSEAISNAIDNRWREGGENMTEIAISIDLQKSVISVFNNGPHIPVKRKTYEFRNRTLDELTRAKLYPAQIYYGEMLAGTNFKDNDGAKSSGRNGIGAKLANIFSEWFIVEHADPENHLRLSQRYESNGTVREKPVIEPYKRKKGWVRVTFKPDLKRFCYPSADNLKLDQDFVSCLRKKAYDCALITGVNVRFVVDDNEEAISVRSLTKYAKLYDSDELTLIRLVAPNDDECVVVDISHKVSSLASSKGVDNISFINGVHTEMGGKHVDAWTDAVITRLRMKLNERKFKKGEELRCTIKDLYPYLRLYVRAEITPRPSFDGQVKSKMVAPVVNLCNSSNSDVLEGWRKKLDKVVTAMIGWPFVVKLDEKLSIRNQHSKIPKVASVKPGAFNNDFCQDASDAGKPGNKAALLISEGKSAAALAKKGIDFIKGYASFGVIAIRGKFINVRKASDIRTGNNAEVRMLMGMLGLDFEKTYEKKKERKTLRYQRGARLFTDADDDGIHIRGLLLNFFHVFWPALIRHMYITSLNTPICMVTSGKKCTPFYSLEEFRSATIRGQVRYLKGLGSSEKKDVEVYFSDPKLVTFTPCEDEEDTNEVMNLGFGKTGTKERKPWITKCLPCPSEDSNRAVDFEEDKPHVIPPYVYEGELPVPEFINDQLIIFDLTSLPRAIPNMYDSFKQAQRKVFYAASLEGRNSMIDMERLQGAVKKETRYHHGSSSMYEVIIGMAQRFVGANNVPLLEEGGMFGTRNDGGSDHAAPRYLATRVEEIAGKIYIKDDERLYTRSVEDNEEVEYKMYVPIVPMVLVNGATGMACGFSTEIPNHSMLEVIRAVRQWVNDEDIDPIPVDYRGYKGKINMITVKGHDRAWHSPAIVSKGKKSHTYVIEEVPIRMWNQQVDNALRELAGQKIDIKATQPKKKTAVPVKKKPKKVTPILSKVQMKGTIDHRRWEVTFRPLADPGVIHDTKGPFAFLYKRQPYMSLSNMHVLDENGYPRRYETAVDLVKDFCPYRLHLYEERKKIILEELHRKLRLAKNRYLFTAAVNDGTLKINSKKHMAKGKLEEEMERLGLERLAVGKTEESYKYLLLMPIQSLTPKKTAQLQEEKNKLETSIEELHKKTPKEMWLEELEILEEAYIKFEKANRLE